MGAAKIAASRALQFLEAFPADAPSIPITGLTGEVESDTARSVFQIFRLCGALVLASMTVTHLMVLDHERILEKTNLAGLAPLTAHQQ